MSNRDSNPYELKTKEDKGYFYEEKPDGYLTSDEFISYLNKKKILIDRADNLPRFANNNNIGMAKLKREGRDGSTPTIYKIPSDSKINEIFEIMKNNNNSLLGRKILKQKKEKILEIFDNAPSAAEYQKRIDAAVGKEEKSKIRNEKNKKCLTKTTIAKKVEEILDVSCNRKLVKSVLETKRSSKLEKLNKIVNAED